MRSTAPYFTHPSSPPVPRFTGRTEVQAQNELSAFDFQAIGWPWAVLLSIAAVVVAIVMQYRVRIPRTVLRGWALLLGSAIFAPALIVTMESLSFHARRGEHAGIVSIWFGPGWGATIGAAGLSLVLVVAGLWAVRRDARPVSAAADTSG
ncbi:hypothetical protein [Nocardia crassostreae]|uniref:hypothetical protein n=1 Tax=Nocardia crassostreae TaxID=53428 RepID=UPI000830973C|nr:hypothetical protein [Nocardia crassostreae]